jgi:hypothetical protein
MSAVASLVALVVCFVIPWRDAVRAGTGFSEVRP